MFGLNEFGEQIFLGGLYAAIAHNVLFIVILYVLYKWGSPKVINWLESMGFKRK